MRCMFWHASKSKCAVFCMRNPSPHAEGVLRGHPSHHTPAVVLCGSGAFPQVSLRPGFLLPRRGWPGCGAAPRSTGPGRPAPAVGANMEGGRGAGGRLIPQEKLLQTSTAAGRPALPLLTVSPPAHRTSARCGLSLPRRLLVFSVSFFNYVREHEHGNINLWLGAGEW
jgi:hypothetical protein